MRENLIRISYIIGEGYRKKVIFLVFLLIIGMFFEILGLGILLPILSLIANPEELRNNIFLETFPTLNSFSFNHIVVLLLAFLGFLYFFKNTFLSFLVYRQNLLLSKMIAMVSNNLFSLYLKQPYSYHLSENSSRLIKVLQTEMSLFRTYNTALISLFVEIGLMISILATLIFIEPIGATLVGVCLGLLSYLFYGLSKIKLIGWGETREKTDLNLSKVVMESLAGIKNIKVLDVEKQFVNVFEYNQNLKAGIISKANTLAQLPRYYLELISILGLVLFILAMLLQNKDLPTLISTIGVFVAAVFRLLPSINKILTAFQNIKYYSPSVEILYQEFFALRKKSKNIEKRHLERPKKTIQFQNITFSYNSGLKPILNDLNLEIKIGETIGIIGPSGQGKSTFIGLLTGLLESNTGTILSDGKDIQSNLKSWRNNIGYVPQDIFLLDDTIEKNITFGRSSCLNDVESVNRVIQRAHLRKFIDDLPNGIHSKVGERGVQISGGQKQRIGIARALYNDPDILIFDEATSALDGQIERTIMDFIYTLKEKKTLIIVAHRLSTLKYCDKIYEINNGKMLLKNKILK